MTEELKKILLDFGNNKEPFLTHNHLYTADLSDGTATVVLPMLLLPTPVSVSWKIGSSGQASDHRANHWCWTLSKDKTGGIICTRLNLLRKKGFLVFKKKCKKPD